MTILALITILCLLVLVHEGGHLLCAKSIGVRVEQFALGFKPTLYKKKVGETTYLLNALPFGGYVTLSGEITEETTILDERSLIAKKWWERLWVLAGGIIANLLFAWILIIGMYSIGFPVPENIASSYPESSVIVTDTGYVLDLPLGQAFAQGTKVTVHLVRDTILGLGTFFSGFFSGNSHIQDMSGPVGLGGIVSEARSLGMFALVMLTAFISINLAIFNLIPFPALDGGQMIIVIYEKITNHRVQPKTVGLINGIGFIALMIIMVLVTISDVTKIIS